MNILLGSRSPRRQEILSFFSLPFEVASSDFDERSISFKENPYTFVENLAEKKGLSLVSHFPKHLIITADTVVYFNGDVFFKPQNEEEARGMLRCLSGRTHEVITAVTINLNGKTYSDHEVTRVTFEELTDKQIDQYVQTTHPMDKAGSYGIQGIGSLLISNIEGCFYNVMGLPIQLLARLLRNVGLDLWDAIGS